MQLQQGYKRNDFIGHVCHRVLYGPLDAQDKIPSKHSKINSEACMSFRFAADYRFLFYFFIFFLTFKSMCHLNNSFCFLLFLIFGLFYILIKCIFTYEKPRLAKQAVHQIGLPPLCLFATFNTMPRRLSLYFFDKN